MLSAQLAVRSNAHILLVLVAAKLLDGILHLPEALVELLNLVAIPLLALIAIGQVTHDIVLVELHETCQVLVLILRVDDLLHVLLELDDDRFLLLGSLLLLRDVEVYLLNLALHAPQILSVILQLGALILEVLLKLEQLVLQVVNLDFLGLEALLHLFSSVGQDMLRLLQIFDLELVLVKISLALVELLDLLFLGALLLLDVLLELLNMVALLVACSHSLLVLLVDLLLLGGCVLLLTFVLAKVASFLVHLFAKAIFFLVVLHLEVCHFVFVRGLLLIELLAVVILELRGELFALLKLNVYLAQVRLELFEQAIDGCLVLHFDLLNLLLVALLHLETFLFELKVAVALLLELLLEDALDLLDFFVVVALDLSHRLLVLVLLLNLLLFQVKVALLEILDVFIFLLA